MSENNYNQVEEESLRALEEEFNTKPNIAIMPYRVVAGVDDISKGVYTNNIDGFKDDQFERFFNGQNPIIVLWKDSTKAIYQVSPGGITLKEKNAYKDYSRGEVLYGLLRDSSESVI